MAKKLAKIDWKLDILKGDSYSMYNTNFYWYVFLRMYEPMAIMTLKLHANA